MSTTVPHGGRPFPLGDSDDPRGLAGLLGPRREALRAWVACCRSRACGSWTAQRPAPRRAPRLRLRSLQAHRAGPPGMADPRALARRAYVPGRHNPVGTASVPSRKERPTVKRSEFERESAFLTADQLCKLFAISRSTLARWRAQGFPRVRVGGVMRYPRSLCIRWVWEQELKGAIRDPRDKTVDRPNPWTSDEQIEKAHSSRRLGK